MKNVRFIALILLCVISVTTLCGCFNNRYNAVLYDDQLSSVKKWMDEDFLVNNRVYGHYKDENGETFLFKDQKDPIVHIINTEDQYNSIFKNGAPKINFDKQTVVLYIFSCHNPRNYYIKSISVKENTLYVELKYPSSTKSDATGAYQRCFMIVMDKVSIHSVEFEISESEFINEEMFIYYEKIQKKN